MRHRVHLGLTPAELVVKTSPRSQRDGAGDYGDRGECPTEVFTLATDIVAVDGPTAVVRAEVCYGDPPGQEYRDLWVIRLADDGRCTWFEEWPCWPGRPRAARDDLA